MELGLKDLRGKLSIIPQVNLLQLCKHKAQVNKHESYLRVE